MIGNAKINKIYSLKQTSSKKIKFKRSISISPNSITSSFFSEKKWEIDMYMKIMFIFAKNKKQSRLKRQNIIKFLIFKN